MNFQDIIKQILNKLNFLDHEQKLSLTNICVAVFILITAFRSLFGGSVFHISSFTWNVQTINYGDTLPLLYGLLNYHGKRMSIDKAVINETIRSTNVQS